MNPNSNEEIDVGSDSFMDTIANLVGVLIILVAVVSLKAEKIIKTADKSSERQTQMARMANDLTVEQSQANGLEIDAVRLEQDLASEQRLQARLSYERHQKLIWMELARRQIEEQKLSLDDQQRRQLESQAEKSRLEQNLAQIEMRCRALQTTAAKTEDLIHYPTPIAKTVFSDEVHFRMERGTIAHVPINELIAQMKAEWKYKAEKLQQHSSTIETVGPIENFRMEYELVVEPEDAMAPPAMNQRMMIRFNRFVIEPLSENAGESFEKALTENSAFRSRLERLVPGKTTVSIWVYPDSYRELAKLKEWLRERGFQTACWPLETGRPITGGPNGMRSTAQ